MNNPTPAAQSAAMLTELLDAADKLVHVYGIESKQVIAVQFAIESLRAGERQAVAWVPFNLNHYVKIKLSAVGLAEHKRLHDELYEYIISRGGKRPEYVPPKLDEEGWHQVQLWCVMQEYGHLVGMGKEPPFETTMQLQMPPPPASVRHGMEMAAEICDEQQHSVVLRKQEKEMAAYLGTAIRAAADKLPDARAGDAANYVDRKLSINQIERLIKADFECELLENGLVRIFLADAAMQHSPAPEGK